MKTTRTAKMTAAVMAASVLALSASSHLECSLRCLAGHGLDQRRIADPR